MGDHRIVATDWLRAGERKRLESLAGCREVPSLVSFLSEQFGVRLDTDPDIIAGYARDSSNLPASAQALARPDNPRDLAVVLAASQVAGIPVTVTAGKSNLTGSATPEGGILVSLSGFQSPAVSVDMATRLVRAPVGMILEDMRRAVVEQSKGNLVYPVDPTSRADATVGGTIACNASGFVPGEQGATRCWVEWLECLLPDGRRIEAKRGQYVSRDGCFLVEGGAAEPVQWPVPRHARPPIKNAGGPFSAPDGVLDFVDLIVGSEGIFGVVTGVALRLEPPPAAVLDLFFSLPDEARAVQCRNLLAESLEGGLGSLRAFEYFGVNCRRYMDHESVFFPGNDQVAIYLQAPVPDGDVETAAGTWLERLMELDCAIDDAGIRLLDTERTWKQFMEARHSLPAKALEVVQQRGAFTIMTDTVVPADQFETFLDFTHHRLAEERLEYVAFGHLGDCHLHFTILPERDSVVRALAAYDAIVARSAELGGVYSGEHGTGKRKRADFLRCYGPTAVDGVAACKRAVDPGFLLNRNNVIPVPEDVAQ